MTAENGAATETDIRAYRLARVKAQLAARDLAGIVLFDPINIRYATGSRNMQVWTMHNACRYAFVAAEGPVVLFDFSAALHLAKDLATVDECRPAKSWDYGAVGGREGVKLEQPLLITANGTVPLCDYPFEEDYH